MTDNDAKLPSSKSQNDFVSFSANNDDVNVESSGVSGIDKMDSSSVVVEVNGVSSTSGVSVVNGVSEMNEPPGKIATCFYNVIVRMKICYKKMFCIGCQSKGKANIINEEGKLYEILISTNKKDRKKLLKLLHIHDMICVDDLLKIYTNTDSVEIKFKDLSDDKIHTVCIDLLNKNYNKSSGFSKIIQPIMFDIINFNDMSNLDRTFIN
jgi:hypothetical protein